MIKKPQTFSKVMATAIKFVNLDEDRKMRKNEEEKVLKRKEQKRDTRKDQNLTTRLIREVEKFTLLNALILEILMWIR